MGFTGIRFTWQFLPFRSTASFAASSCVSFTPATRLYSKEITKKLYEFIEKNNIQENILKKAEELEEKEQSTIEKYLSEIQNFILWLGERSITKNIIF